jgi:hypothetical protein
MSYYTINQRRHGRQKWAGIKRYTHTPSIREINLENISNLRNVFLENKVWKVCQTFWDFLNWVLNVFFVNKV